MTESVYGNSIGVMRNMGWTWDEYLDAPADMVDEIEALLAGEAKARK